MILHQMRAIIVTHSIARNKYAYNDDKNSQHFVRMAIVYSNLVIYLYLRPGLPTQLKTHSRNGDISDVRMLLQSSHKLTNISEQSFKFLNLNEENNEKIKKKTY